MATRNLDALALCGVEHLFFSAGPLLLFVLLFLILEIVIVDDIIYKCPQTLVVVGKRYLLEGGGVAYSRRRVGVSYLITYSILD